MVLFVYFFVVFYLFGEGLVLFIYSVEVFFFLYREVGMGFLVVMCFFWVVVLGMMFLFLFELLGMVGVFGLYVGFNVLVLVMIFFWVFEMK